MAPGGTRPTKRVKATNPHTGVTTRSGKNLASTPPNEDRTANNLASTTPNEDRSTAASDQAVHDQGQAVHDQVQREGQEPVVEPRSPFQDWSYHGIGSDVGEGAELVAPNESNQPGNAGMCFSSMLL